MGEFIANKVVKLMIHKNLTIKGSKVLVMGITFKENCPDLRNSKVIDVINELKEFDLDVEVFDPQADQEEVQHEYGLKLKSEKELSTYNAVIHAVSHKEFNSYDFKSLLNLNGVLYDVKSVLPKEIVDGRL
jgi:UDP-N-acetyl-D-galactosamine dehydrogenase